MTGGLLLRDATEETDRAAASVSVTSTSAAGLARPTDATQNSGGSFDHASSLSPAVSASRITGLNLPAGESSTWIG